MSDITVAARPRGVAFAALTIIAIGAAAFGTLVVASRLLALFSVSTASSLTVVGMPLGNAQEPEFMNSLDVSDARYSGVDFTILEAPASLRWLDFWVHVAGSVSTIALCAVVAWLCLVSLRGRPFVRHASLSMMLSGGVIVGANIAADLLTSRLHAGIIEHFGGEYAAGSREGGPGEGFTAGTFVSLEGLGLGFLLVAVGVAFALGARMQRDSDKLV